MTETIATLKAEIAAAAETEARAIKNGNFGLFLVYRRARNEREAMLTTLTVGAAQ